MGYKVRISKKCIMSCKKKGTQLEMSLYTIRKCEKMVKFKGKNQNKTCSSLGFWQIKKPYSFRACVFTLEHVGIEYIRKFKWALSWDC